MRSSQVAKNLENALLDAVQTSFLDRNHPSREDLRSRLVKNEKGLESIASHIQRELRGSTSFDFAVSFIKLSGLSILALSDIINENGSRIEKGRILTSNYMNVTEPEALEFLLEKLGHKVEVRVFDVPENSTSGFHTKGYHFKKDGYSSLIIGSANMTQTALKASEEWAILTSSLDDSMLTKTFEEEFERLWNTSALLSYDFIEEYRSRYEMSEKGFKLVLSCSEDKRKAIVPNKMQNEALEGLERIRREGKKKALVIAATGSGKTYLAAFDVKKTEAKRVLFVIHRSSVLYQAAEDFERILGDVKGNSAFYYGNSADMEMARNAKYVFATVQTLSKEEKMKIFNSDAFSYMIVDEVHRAAAPSYSKILSYFTPDFLLGLTATPTRPDGESIYKLFDYNIAYEINLSDALENDLVCPFHYFGISEMVFEDGMRITDDSSFNMLVSDERVSYISQKLSEHPISGKKLRALVFTRRNDEAEELSSKFNELKGENGEKLYRTIALSGRNTENERARAIIGLSLSDDEEMTVDEARMENEDVSILQGETGNEKLPHYDMIFTVDIFNEAVSIKKVNTIVMLRPTESIIIFLQQLGRGLRKLEKDDDEKKEYVTVLDFIGNYHNNFLITVALSGTKEARKDGMRDIALTGTNLLSGCASIFFDTISRKRIFESIERANLGKSALLREEYEALKERLGRIPRVLDFKKEKAIDIERIFEHFGSYHNFLKKYEKEYETKLSTEEEAILEFVTGKVSGSKRIHDTLMLYLAMNEEGNIREKFIQTMIDRFGIYPTGKEISSTIGNLTNFFPQDRDKGKTKDAVFLKASEDESTIEIDPLFSKRIKANKSFRNWIEEMLSYSFIHYEDVYSKRYKDTNFVLYERYSYEDVLRLENFKRNQNGGTIGGYFYSEENDVFIIFINYVKADDAIGYHDRFISEDTLIAISKKNRSTTSKDANIIYRLGDAYKNTRFHLFMRKNCSGDRETKDFRFLGEVNALGMPKGIRIDNTDAFEIEYKLETRLPEMIYSEMTMDFELDQY